MPVVVAEHSTVPQAFMLDTAAVMLIDLIWDTGDVVRLFVNDIVPTTATALADLTEASFSTYAAEPFTLIGTLQANFDGSIQVLQGAPLEWAGPADLTGQTVYGYYVTNSGGTVLKTTYRFPSPVSLTGEHDVLTLLPGLTLPPIT
jgi:hypothetical protein